MCSTLTGAVLKVATPGTSKSPPNCTAPVNVEAPDTS